MVHSTLGRKLPRHDNGSVVGENLAFPISSRDLVADRIDALTEREGGMQEPAPFALYTNKV